MESLRTGEARALVALQRQDTALDALKAKAAAVPVKIEERERTFRAKVESMNGAREALLALQSKKKAVELEIASTEELVRKHQRDLNAIKDNQAFKALLTEIDTCKKKQDELETADLTVMDEIDAATAEDAKLKAEVKVLERAKNAEVEALRAEHLKLEHEAAAAAAARAAAAAAISPDLLDRYEHLRARRAGKAVVEAHEDPKSGKFSCGGCHMALTPQKVLDAKKKDSFAVCEDCRRFLYIEKVVFGEPGQG